MFGSLGAAVQVLLILYPSWHAPAPDMALTVALGGAVYGSAGWSPVPMTLNEAQTPVAHLPDVAQFALPSCSRRAAVSLPYRGFSDT